MRALVLQHIACEPPGVYEDVLVEHGVELIRVELDEGGPLPGWRDFDLIVAMGGPMSVNDEDALPWGRVPEYAAALARTLRADAAERLVEEVAARADELRGHARTLFGRWLELARQPVAA